MSIEKYKMRNVSNHPDRVKRISQLDLFLDNDSDRLVKARVVELFKKKR